MSEPERARPCRTFGLTSLWAALALIVFCSLVALNSYNADKDDGWGTYDELSEGGYIDESAGPWENYQ